MKGGLVILGIAAFFGLVRAVIWWYDRRWARRWKLLSYGNIKYIRAPGASGPTVRYIEGALDEELLESQGWEVIDPRD